MKINPVMTLIALAIAALAAYGFYVSNNGEQNQWLITVGSGVTIFISLGGCLAVFSETRDLAGNIRVTSLVFLIIGIISHIIFSLISGPGTASYIIVNGIILLLFVLIAYSTSRALK
ncbi:MAG: hypothetical protein LBP23_09335 [Treponema sp.]|jgi:FtsH-binding integral membrane protein|nr:hypothetical protein [Treponema sp.]